MGGHEDRTSVAAGGLQLVACNRRCSDQIMDSAVVVASPTGAPCGASGQSSHASRHHVTNSE